MLVIKISYSLPCVHIKTPAVYFTARVILISTYFLFPLAAPLIPSNKGDLVASFILFTAVFAVLFSALWVAAGFEAAFLIPSAKGDLTACFTELVTAFLVAGLDAAFFIPVASGELSACLTVLPAVLLVELVVVFHVAIILFLLVKKYASYPIGQNAPVEWLFNLYLLYHI